MEERKSLSWSIENTKDINELLTLISECNVEQVNVIDTNTGKTPLMCAAIRGDEKILDALLMGGANWNTMDKNSKCAGDYACNEQVHELLLNHAIRSEMILSVVQKNNQKKLNEEKQVPNSTYLNNKLTWSDNKIVDVNGDAVMMGWETPLMLEHAKLICSKGGSILNVGFGLGIIDTFIQGHNPQHHTIIEAHPDVYKKMLDDGWGDKPNVTILFGRWQDVIDKLTVYDGIFFDTFGEFYEEMHEFHEELPNILNSGGIYSFFNGLCASSNLFFHQVYCEIVKANLKTEMDIETTYIPMDVDENSVLWHGVRRPYWVLKEYLLPICQFSHDVDPKLEKMMIASIENHQQKAIKK